MKPAPEFVTVSGMGEARMIQRGAEQSVVRYTDGTEQVIPNSWMEGDDAKLENRTDRD